MTTANERKFELGNTVACELIPGRVGTIVKVPTKRSRGFVFGGQYVYDVDFPGYKYGVQRLSESHLIPVEFRLRWRYTEF